MLKRHHVLLIFVISLSITIGILGVKACNKNLVCKATKNSISSPLANSISISSLLKTINQNKKHVVYGYLPYWSLDKAKYLQMNNLTDIAYFGLYINEDGSFKTRDEEGNTDPGYAHWKDDENLLKIIADAQKYKVRVSLTVISHVDEISTKFLNCQTCWDTLYNNLTAELDAKKIYGVNLNFEYVEFTDPDITVKYTEFTKYLKTRLKEKYGDKSYLVVATFADSLVKPRVTDISGLSRVADALFIMAYDFHRPSSDNAGPVAPIGGKGVYAEYDIDTMIKDYQNAADTNKLILGVPYYGYNWVVEENKEYAKRKPGSDASGYSQSQAYTDIMETVLKVNPEIKWDELGQVPYFSYTSPDTNSLREVYFENAQSLDVKYKLAKKNNFAGIGIWALGYDGGYTELWDLLNREFNTY